MKKCNNKRNKVMRGVVLVIALVLSMIQYANPVYAADAQEAPQQEPVVLESFSGECGGNLTWELSGMKLVIRGSGAMENYTEWSMAPWYDYRSRIGAVELPDGLTTVGDLAFYQCDNILSVAIPNSVTAIGSMAFSQCTALRHINLGNALVSIGRSAFESCSSLASIRFPQSLTTIGERAFFQCASLGGVVLPPATVNLSANTFTYCSSLTYAEIQGSITVLPYWFFYGCTSLSRLILPDSLRGIQDSALSACPTLSNVDYDGSEEVRQQIKDAFYNSEDIYTGVSTGTQYNKNDHSEITVTDTSYDILDENGNVRDPQTTIYAAVDDPAGWQDVVSTIRDGHLNPPQTEVYAEQPTVEAGVLTGLSGQEGTVKVHTPDNVVWTWNLADQKKENLQNKQDFSASIAFNDRPTDTQKNVIGETDSFLVKLGETSLNSIVQFFLGKDYAMQVATLYRANDMTVIASVVVDLDGLATFSLAGTDAGDYLIAVNSASVSREEAVIPPALVQEYGYEMSTLTDAQGNQYVVTGLKSNMSLMKVFLILGGVLLAAFVAVGLFMFFMNKRNLERERRRARTRRR